MRVIEPCAEAGCRLATQETSGSRGVAPQSRRDADGGPTARTPLSGQLRSLVSFRQISRDVVLKRSREHSESTLGVLSRLQLPLAVFSLVFSNL